MVVWGGESSNFCHVILLLLHQLSPNEIAGSPLWCDDHSAGRDTPPLVSEKKHQAVKHLQREKKHTCSNAMFLLDCSLGFFTAILNCCCSWKLRSGLQLSPEPIGEPTTLAFHFAASMTLLTLTPEALETFFFWPIGSTVGPCRAPPAPDFDTDLEVAMKAPSASVGIWCHLNFHERKTNIF